MTIDFLPGPSIAIPRLLERCFLGDLGERRGRGQSGGCGPIREALLVGSSASWGRGATGGQDLAGGAFIAAGTRGDLEVAAFLVRASRRGPVGPAFIDPFLRVLSLFSRRLTPRATAPVFF